MIKSVEDLLFLSKDPDDRHRHIPLTAADGGLGSKDVKFVMRPLSLFGSTEYY